MAAQSFWYDIQRRDPMGYHAKLASDPFAYRAPLSDSDLDREEAFRIRRDKIEIAFGRCTEEELEQSKKAWKENREVEKQRDLDLEAWVGIEVDTSESEAEGAPLSPPRSPPTAKADGPDLSHKAWEKERLLIKYRDRYNLDELGFNDYESWKRYQIKHSTSKNKPKRQKASASPRIVRR